MAVSLGLPLAALGGSPGESCATLPAASSQWSTSTSVQSAFGFKDNLLLSASGQEESTFSRASAEVLFMRVPAGRVDYSVFAEAEGTHFFSGRTVHNEASVWVRQNLGIRVGDAGNLSCPVTGYYDDKVFDKSDTEVERLVAELKVRGVMAAPAIRWKFYPGWWIEGQGTAQRERFVDGANDNRTRHAALRLNWSAKDRLGVKLSATRRWRDFDVRTQYSAAGRELSGTHLEVEEDEGECAVNLKWGQNAAWQTTTRAGVLRYRDNGSGYFNYREKKIGQELEWTREPWLVRLSAEARRVEFEVRTVGISTDPPPWIKDGYEAKVHVEYKVSDRWTVYGGYSWERTRSNDKVVSYVVNEGLLGVRWSWE